MRSWLRGFVPVAFSVTQQQFLELQFTRFALLARRRGLSDQQLCEWLLSLGGRWLVAHGIARPNVHAWLEHEMRDARIPSPMVAGAASRNDFGGRR